MNTFNKSARNIQQSTLHLVAVCSLAGLLACIGLPVVHAAPSIAEAQAIQKRPKIGLVLAGGGAKGAAHVGVLKILEEMRIPVDYVAGTSMGSIVGGLYASGMKPAEIEREIQQIDWQDVFNDSPNREDRSFRRKADDALYVFKAKPGFRDGEVQLPLAVIHGQKLDLHLNRLTQRVANTRNFDQLPIPFRAIAADLESGAEVVLKSGNLPRAIRASMAVPGAFDPVELDGKLLVDGGIANNIPISVARAMGADVVIVSELGVDMLTREEIKSALSVAAQMVNFLFVINSREQLKTLGAKDVRISVKLGDIGAGSFERIKETIPLGEAAAKEASSALSRYSLSVEDYNRHLAARSAFKTEAPRIDFIRIDNKSKVGNEVIARRISAKTGEQLDLVRLEEDIQQIYGLEIFESVRYALLEENGQTGLVIQAKEKPWGPGYLQTGLITANNFKGDSTFNLGLTYTRTPINALNGEWRTGLQIGDRPGIFTEIFQPLDPEARYFAAAKVGYGINNVNIFDVDGNKTSELRMRSYALDVAMGRQFGTWGEARLGYFRRSGTADIEVGVPQPHRDFDSGEAYIRLISDKMDSLYFPTKGHFGIAEWRVSRKGLGADSNFEQGRLAFQGAYSWGRNTLTGGVDFNHTFDGTAPSQSLFSLGGFMRLSGFEQNRLTGQHSGLVRVAYLRRINDIQHFKAYLGASLEMGNVWQRAKDISVHDNIVAGSVFIGADTPIGPVYFGYGRNDTGKGSIYLYLGPIFSF